MFRRASRASWQIRAVDSVTRSDREEKSPLAGATRRGRRVETFIRICGRRFGREGTGGTCREDSRRSTPVAFGWLEASLSLNSLLNEIDGARHGLPELVKAVKSYSYMDQTPMQELDVHEGLENTLTMLGHKLKKVTVTRKYDRAIPRILAYGGELNQCGPICSTTPLTRSKGRENLCRYVLDDDQVGGEIADNGSGIPPEVQSAYLRAILHHQRSWVGNGPGLVISSRIVANRHNGEIEFSSAPGDTPSKCAYRSSHAPQIELTAVKRRGVGKRAGIDAVPCT